MAEILLRTKLSIPPLRASLVHRPHLIERLDHGLQLGHKLTLISAPAGFGKTTLVCEWVGNLRLDTAKESQIHHQIAWLSLDEGDNDPLRFLVYFVTALKQVEGIETTLGEAALSMLRTPQPPPTNVILSSLINEVSDIPDRIILVLDDYHSIESAAVDDALTFLLEHLPPQMHLVIATRNDPNLQISRLRGRGQLTELRALDLRFSASEAAEFLNRVMGLDLSADDISTLETRTEGWIAGLQLAAISMQGHKDTASLIKSFTGSHRIVLDYLIEEVLNQQPQDIQTFLLQTSVLYRLTGSLCDALTGQEDGQVTLEMLEHANLFIIPLDAERCWYRYHHLFADLLRQRLHQTQPGQEPTLHQRASEWYEQNGFTDEPIEHALHAEDFERAARLLVKQADTIWGRGEHNKLNRWVERLPNEIFLSKPQLCISNAVYQFINGQEDAAEQSLLAAENALSQSVNMAPETAPTNQDLRNDSGRVKIQGRIATIRAEIAFYRGDLQGIQKFSKLALTYLPEQDLAWRGIATAVLGDAYALSGEPEEACRIRQEAFELSIAGKNHYLRLLSIMKLASTLRQQGRLNQIVEIFQQQLQFANESGMSQTDVFGCMLAIWGEVLAEFNDLEGAIDLARKGVELAERGRDVAIFGWSYLFLMRVLFSLGDFNGVEEIHRKIEKINRELFVPPWIKDQITAWQTRVWLVQGKLEASSQWVLDRGLNIDGELTYLRATEYLMFARHLIAQERLDEASTLLERLSDVAKAKGLIAKLIEILILQALVFQAKGDTESATAILEEAITLAEPEGFVCIFLDEGPPMARLLYEALSRGISPDYVRQLLGEFPLDESEQATSTKSKVDQSEMIEPLSEREIEVLELVAEGLSSREIAARLYLSPNTVKVHTRNINGKLGVNSRVKAVVKARALGVLPST